MTCGIGASLNKIIMGNEKCEINRSGWRQEYNGLMVYFKTVLIFIMGTINHFW